MRRTSKRPATLAALVITAGALLAACGADTSDVSAAADVTSAPTTATTAAAAGTTSTTATSAGASSTTTAAGATSPVTPPPRSTVSTTPPASTSTTAAGPTETVLHSNTFDMVFGDDQWTGAFTWDGNYAISAGQPWEGVTVTPAGPRITILAMAGRHGTKEVAEWFRQRASAAVANGDIFDSWPSDLNFAFTGTLTVNGTEFPAVIGQGNSLFENNWWIGGPGWVQDGGISTNCGGAYTNTVNGSTRYFLPWGGASGGDAMGVYSGPC